MVLREKKRDLTALKEHSNTEKASKTQTYTHTHTMLKMYAFKRTKQEDNSFWRNRCPKYLEVVII